jgi:hypothetical protein
MYIQVYYSKTAFCPQGACLFRMIFTMNIDYIPKYCEFVGLNYDDGLCCP